MTVTVSGTINLSRWPNQAGGNANGYGSFSYSGTFSKSATFGTNGLIGSATVASWTSQSGTQGYRFKNPPFVNIRASNGNTAISNYNANATQCNVSLSSTSAGKNSDGSTSGATLNVSTNNVSYTESSEEVWYYTVTFVDGFGTTLKTQEVQSGANATPPSNPSHSGYQFDGWSGTYTNVISDRTITAQWREVFTLSYNTDGGTPQRASQSQTAGNLTLAAAVSKSGYVFVGWQIDETVYSASAPYNLTSNTTATALWIGHKGITTSVSLPSAAPNQPTPLSVTISPASQDGGWDEGTAITATAPASGLGVEFEAWNVTGAEVQVITANPLSFTMSDLPVSLTATYKMKELAVTCAVDAAARTAGAVASGANTYITDAGGQQSPTGFQYDDTVIFHAPEPESGFTFAGWYDASGVQRSANINYTLMLTSDITLYARYAVTVTVTKDEEDGSGTFSVNGATYQAVEITLPAELGQPLAIAATPADGSYFGGWKIDGAMSDLFREDSVTVTAAHVFTAVFVSEPVSVSVTCLSEKNDPQAEGSIGSLAVLGATGTEGVFSVDGFSEITLVPSPSSESGALPLFRVVEVITEGQTEGYREVAAPYVVRVSNADRTFKALWGEKANFLITVSSEDEAKGVAYVGESPSVRSAVYAQDTQVAVTALPTNGHKFVGWYENDEIVSTDARYVFVVLNESRTLEARFEDDAFAICEWEGSDEPKTMEWTSKVYVTAKPFDPVAARVDATGYPVDLTVRTYSSPDKAEPTALPDRPHALTAANPFPIQSQDGRRLPRMRPERYVQITVKSSHEIDAVVVGTNMTEVN